MGACTLRLCGYLWLTAQNNLRLPSARDPKFIKEDSKRTSGSKPGIQRTFADADSQPSCLYADRETATLDVTPFRALPICLRQGTLAVSKRFHKKIQIACNGSVDSWQVRFAETPDVLKSARHKQSAVPVLDIEIGGNEFITTAGPCSVETEFQLMATANHVRPAGARILRGGEGVLPSVQRLRARRMQLKPSRTLRGSKTSALFDRSVIIECVR